MPTINYRDLKRRVELDGLESTSQHLREALDDKHLRPDDFSIKSLYETLVVNGEGQMVGADVLKECFDPRGPQKSASMMEAAGAVSSDQFSNITGQIFFNKIMEAAQNPEFLFTRIVPNVPTQLSGERIPGIGQIGDQALIVNEGEAFPLVGVTEDYIDTPATTKRGEIVPVTKEAVFFDRTNILLARCAAVGESLGINKEKRIINCVVDENSTAHRYKWRGTVIATYGDNSGTHSWDNLQATNTLIDYTSVANAELLLAAMLDPNTGEPMILTGRHLVVNPQLRFTAQIIGTATALAVNVGGYATSGNLYQTQAPNPLGKTEFSPNFEILSSRWMPPQTATDTTWYYGDVARGFAYMQNWPITVVTAPINSEAEFTQDIIYRYKASERGAAATLEPRAMVKNTV